MDHAIAATAAAVNGTARRVNGTARRDGTAARMDATATATMADATAAAIRSTGARAAATTLHPAASRADMANPTAPAPAIVLDASTSVPTGRGTWAANGSELPDSPNRTRAAARAPPLQTPANARRSTGPGGGGASARIGWERPPRAPPTILRGLPQERWSQHCPRGSLTGPNPRQPS